MRIFLFTLMAGIFFSGCSSRQQNRVELVLDSRSDLGEGAIWNHKTGELIWVNITKKILNFYVLKGKISIISRIIILKRIHFD